ncbi:hypothetical protein FG386_003402 [Cryptosporidium ryanae]|uniref:uncharacterized protein n=1 Tax=Cryptosporidium ryanae TaxID=515981 RepID=UPI003519F5C3|nr:hypothetical protein FG386_003402 [Cryptosporidium ryanae]
MFIKLGLRISRVFAALSFLLFKSHVENATFKPSSYFVTQTVINTYSSFCWEHSGNAMYFPILVSSNTGWGSTLVVQFDLSAYKDKIKYGMSSDSVININTYCDTTHCGCNENRLKFTLMATCTDLCSRTSYLVKDPETIVQVPSIVTITSDHLETAPSSLQVNIGGIFQYSIMETLLNSCDLRYFTIGVTNTGKCTSWIDITSWVINGL